jgi:hypothetical protein
MARRRLELTMTPTMISILSPQGLQDGTLSRLPQRGCKGRPGLCTEAEYLAVPVDRVPDENDAVTAGSLYALPSVGA